MSPGAVHLNATVGIKRNNTSTSMFTFKGGEGLPWGNLNPMEKKVKPNKPNASRKERNTASKKVMDFIWAKTQAYITLLKAEQRFQDISRSIDDRWDMAEAIALVTMKVVEQKEQCRGDSKKDSPEPVEPHYPGESFPGSAFSLVD